MKRNYYEYYHSLNLFEGIPLVITKAHHQVLQYWIDSGLRDSELLHIDGHADMCDHVPLSLTEDENEKRHLHIANFICPAVYLGVVSSIYWLNPHSLERRLQDLGSVVKQKERPYLSTKVDVNDLIVWDEYWKKNLIDGCGIIKKQWDFKLKTPFILDVDLDAFCCDAGLEYINFDYEGISNYEERIGNTIGFLDRLQLRPELITVTRSQAYGHRWTNSFVPANLVDDVQRVFLECLRRLYKK